MSVLQIILIIIASIITLFFLIASLLPSSRTMYRNIIIESPPGDIYRLVTDFNNYKKWNPWSAREPEAEKKISGKPGTIGHKWSWKGEKIGAGYLQIRELEKDKSVRSDLIFTAPRKMTSEDIWKFEKLDKNKTRVTWGHYSVLGYPAGRYFGLALDRMLGPDFEKGLKNLKRLSESRARNE